MALLTSSLRKKKLNSALAALSGFKEFSVALGMGSEGADQLARDIRHFVGPAVDDIRVRRIIGRASQVHTSLEAMTRFRADLLAPFRDIKIALVVVDFQNDFTTGSLSIKNGTAREDPAEALPVLNTLLNDSKADMVVYTMDWHPANHISFYEHCRNGDRVLCEEDRGRKLKPLDLVRFDQPLCAQVLYPSHCVQNSWGADLDPRLHVVEGAVYVRKGTEVLLDSYSAFQDNEGVRKTNLEDLLREGGVGAVIGCGLAYDICVAATLKDAAQLGFFTAIVSDASKGMDRQRIAETNEAFSCRRTAVLHSAEAAEALRKKSVPIEWIEKRADDLLQD